MVLEEIKFQDVMFIVSENSLGIDFFFKLNEEI